MQTLSYIIWNANPKIFPNGLFGWQLPIVWYGLLFAFGFLLSQQILFYIHKKEGKPEKDVETLTIYMVVATIIGARLGHVLFYETSTLWENPLDVINFWDGGFRGLASHGGAIGIFIALWTYANYEIKIKVLRLKVSIKKQKRKNQSFLQVLDRIAIVTALTGCLIRFGNFTNSEIIGKPIEGNSGVVFARSFTDHLKPSNRAIESITYASREADNDENGNVPININVQFKRGTQEAVVRSTIENTAKGTFNQSYIQRHFAQDTGKPLDYTLSESDGKTIATISTFAISRHPAQLYESISCLVIFLILMFVWSRKKLETPKGLLFGLFLTLIFGLRFLYEYIKENQVAFEDDLPLNMGQILSIPLVIVGLIIIFRVRKQATPSSE
ncbi:MAG: prolipoprotein diacylglyceryl transferase [Bacteroidota bacterium]